MTNEALVRSLIRCSIRRAVVEGVAAAVVLAAFAALLPGITAGTPAYYGCLLIIAGAGFIAGVVWSHALSYRLLSSHPASDVGFWRAAFQLQARLLRLVPIWYCAPLGLGCVLFIVPRSDVGQASFLLLSSMIVAGTVVVGWLNRSAARSLDEAAGCLAEGLTPSRFLYQHS